MIAHHAHELGKLEQALQSEGSGSLKWPKNGKFTEVVTITVGDKNSKLIQTAFQEQ